MNEWTTEQSKKNGQVLSTSLASYHFIFNQTNKPLIRILGTGKKQQEKLDKNITNQERKKKKNKKKTRYQGKMFSQHKENNVLEPKGKHGRKEKRKKHKS